MIITKKMRLSVILFLLPALLIYVVLAVLPIIESIGFSFFNWNGVSGSPMEFVGLKNFMKISKYSQFYQALKNVFWYTILNLILQIPIGYMMGYLLAAKTRGYRFVKALCFIPVILPMTATALVFQMIFGANEGGALNAFLIAIGVLSKPTGWLIQKSTALLCVIIANVWCGFGYHMTIGYAAVSEIPQDVIEAAELDGAKGFQKIKSIIIPSIKESLKISTVMIITGSIKTFDIIFIMTEGGPNGMTQVPGVMMYNEAFKYNRYGVGSAVSVVIFVLCILFSILSLKIMHGKAEKE